MKTNIIRSQIRVLLTFIAAVLVYVFVLGGPFGLSEMLVIAGTILVLNLLASWIGPAIKRRRKLPLARP